MRIVRSSLLALALGAAAVPVAAVPAAAAPVLLDFEGLSDLEDVTTQFAADGIIFGGASALVSGTLGGSLNEFEFPPSSGDVVIFDAAAGGLTIDFALPVNFVRARVTYTSRVTMTAFLGAGVMGSASSLFMVNTGSSANAPNEILQLTFANPITRLVIAGSPDGGSFTLDDLLVDRVDVKPIPEPATSVLVLLGLGVAGVRRACARTARRTPPR